MRLHHLFGLTLASDFPFAHRLGEGTGHPDLTFVSTVKRLVPEGPASRLYSSPWRNPEGESAAHLDRFTDMEVFRFPPVADFWLEPRCITGHLLETNSVQMMELRLLGPVLCYWLERIGIPVLHGSAVRLGSTAVAFLSRHGGGKSSLAAAFMQAGAPLLSDDILPIDDAGGAFLARPGYPQMRMEPDAARQFLGSDQGLAHVAIGESKLCVPVGHGGWGTFESSSLPLSAIYVAERRPSSEGDVEVTPLPRSEAVIELVRHSFSPYLVEAVGLQPRRLELFARLVRQVPVLRLSYPSGFEHLPRIAELLKLRPM